MDRDAGEGIDVIHLQEFPGQRALFETEHFRFWSDDLQAVAGGVEFELPGGADGLPGFLRGERGLESGRQGVLPIARYGPGDGRSGILRQGTDLPEKAELPERFRIRLRSVPLQELIVPAEGRFLLRRRHVAAQEQQRALAVGQGPDRIVDGVEAVHRPRTLQVLPVVGVAEAVDSGPVLKRAAGSGQRAAGSAADVRIAEIHLGHEERLAEDARHPVAVQRCGEVGDV
ncbi:hypothetical protein SDC9_173649 [bioreactor metagenome]|uniref:Uncharacterized protein n=1 Tax=bioreactor metagenome TaxID=1076179 RepID=A0A645GHR2_9ZZZZ